MEVVLKIFKERRIEIGCLKGIPMLSSPIIMIAYAHIFHQAFSSYKIRPVYWHRKIQNAIRRVDSATIPDALLDIMFMLFYENRFTALLKSGEP